MLRNQGAPAAGSCGGSGAGSKEAGPSVLSLRNPAVVAEELCETSYHSWIAELQEDRYNCANLSGSLYVNTSHSIRLSAEMERKMYNLSKNLDVEEVTNMLLDDADPTLNEDLGEESEIDSHDEVEVCEVDSETEQDGDSDEDEDVESYYMGKDKKKQWNKKPLQKKRREPQNIITHLPAVSGPKRDSLIEIDSCALRGDM
ncbi:uncharacterized protein [Phyllobates terribilis]|uniref:uncharacterized protein n=1 Tax=Phyllobates terribilis TaxID=111132 RepID=UPI003CCACDA2